MTDELRILLGDRGHTFVIKRVRSLLDSCIFGLGGRCSVLPSVALRRLWVLCHGSCWHRSLIPLRSDECVS
jgi:hypothetical protein